MVDNSINQKVDHFINRGGTIIKSRHGWNDIYSHSGKLQHIFEMYGRERSLPGDQDQLPALFDHYISSSFDQVVGHA